MDYEKAKDWELNVAVAKALGYDAMPVQFHEAAVATVYIKNGVPRAGLNQKDYCNNPSDAWPIIVDNGIATAPVANAKWMAQFVRKKEGPFSAGNFESRYDFVEAKHKNPLRAAMIVFLKMKEAE